MVDLEIQVRFRLLNKGRLGGSGSFQTAERWLDWRFGVNSRSCWLGDWGNLLVWNDMAKKVIFRYEKIPCIGYFSITSPLSRHAALSGTGSPGEGA